jgi:uridine phosphorylase
MNRKKTVSYELLNKWDAWLKGGALTSEMESSTLFIVGSYLRVHVGSVLLVCMNQERDKPGKLKVSEGYGVLKLQECIL